MKIAVLAPGTRILDGGGKSIFPTGFLALKIAEELVKRNHQVDFFASADSKIDANLKSFGLNSVFNENLRSNSPGGYLESVYKYCLFMASAVVKDSGNYDIIHAHDYRQLMYFSEFTKCPILYTYHGNIDDDIKDTLDIKRNERFYDTNSFVSISHSQNENAKKYFNFVGNVYNGIEVEKVPFNKKPTENILFVGRLIERKSPDIAIKISQNLDKKIVVIGTKHPPQSDLIYYEKTFLPLTKNKNVNYLGFIPYPDIYQKYAEAKVLLFPINWNEPFGLVMIEAMAAGTPVIAFDKGSVREIVKDGVTGFICPPGDVDYMTKMTRKIYSMDSAEYQKMRTNCRKHVEENFTIKRMVSGYEKIYSKIIEDKQRSKYENKEV